MSLQDAWAREAARDFFATAREWICPHGAVWTFGAGFDVGEEFCCCDDHEPPIVMSLERPPAGVEVMRKGVAPAFVAGA